MASRAITISQRQPYYLTYLLDLISIVEIRIERQQNVAMIFEVVNDRGVGLKPYEILKGKLIGNLDQPEKETANAVWSALQERYFEVELKNATEKTIDLDMFFQTFFRAKFADTEKEYEGFEGVVETLVDEHILPEGASNNIAELFEFERFRGIRNQWTNFSKYVLMRIDRYLAELLDKPSYASEGLPELEDRF